MGQNFTVSKYGLQEQEYKFPLPGYTCPAFRYLRFVNFLRTWESMLQRLGIQLLAVGHLLSEAKVDPAVSYEKRHVIWNLAARPELRMRETMPQKLGT